MYANSNVFIFSILILPDFFSYFSAQVCTPPLVRLCFTSGFSIDFVFGSIQKVLVCLSFWSVCEASFRFELGGTIISQERQKYIQNSISLKEN